MPLGFAPASRARQLEAEAKALAVPTPENARKWLKTLTAEPHVAGTPADYKTAVFVRDRLQEWGWKAELVTYEVLLNYPSGKPRLDARSPGQEGTWRSMRRRSGDGQGLGQQQRLSARSTAMESAALRRVRLSMRTTLGPKISPHWRSSASR